MTHVQMPREKAKTLYFSVQLINPDDMPFTVHIDQGLYWRDSVNLHGIIIFYIIHEVFFSSNLQNETKDQNSNWNFAAEWR